MAPVPQRRPDGLLVLHGISWPTYSALLNDLEAHPGHRVAFDRGTLEITSPSELHENLKSVIGRMIEQIVLELNIECRSAGSTTWRREDLARGLEPDECYYIANESRVRGREVNLMVDPPPDLAVEVDITRPGIEKLAIYAALGVPEVWKFDGRKLSGFVLDVGGGYREVRQSAAFPFLQLNELERFLNKLPGTTETRLLREFRDWVRREFADRAQP